MVTGVCLSSDRCSDVKIVVSSSWFDFDSIFLPAKASEHVFTGVGLCVSVCLSMTMITEKIVDGFVPNFMGRFLGRKGKTKFVFRYDG